MDVISIFPILLVFMITVLMALGYALQQLAKTSYSGDVPSIPSLKCPQCQQDANMNWIHCPACGIVLAYELSLDTTTPRPNRAGSIEIADPNQDMVMMHWGT